MAQKRMFNRDIVKSDSFVSMSLGAQALYFQLCMDSDDDGAVSNLTSVRRQVAAEEKNYQELIDRHFVIHFERNTHDAICFIKHHFINNDIRNDRKKDTVYQEELSCLKIKENQSYAMPCGQLPDNCRTSDGQTTDKCLPSVVEYSVVEISIGESSASDDENAQTWYDEVLKLFNESFDANYLFFEQSVMKRLVELKEDRRISLEHIKTAIDNVKQEYKESNDSKKRSMLPHIINPVKFFGDDLQKHINGYSSQPKEMTEEEKKERYGAFYEPDRS